MKEDIKLSAILVVFLKIVIVLFMIKVIAKATGFVGYIPGADEVYGFIMSVVLAASGNTGVLPHGL